MKKYLKDGFVVYHYEFDTLQQFLTQIQSRPINQNVFSKLISHETDTRIINFTGTKNFEEAVDLCQKGWSEDFEKLVSIKKRIDKRLLSSIIKPRQVQDIVGYNPSVPDYLIGNPLNMWNKTKKQNFDSINIYINIDYNYKTNKNSIFNRGIIVLSLIDALQQKGYNVIFKAFCCSHEDNELLFASFNLKNDREKLNIKKTYFPLCHPSFVRRLGFLLEETTPFECKSWENGYGFPSRFTIFKNIINPGPNDIIITQPLEMGIRGYDIYDDLESFLMHTNLQEFLTRI